VLQFDNLFCCNPIFDNFAPHKIKGKFTIKRGSTRIYYFRILGTKKVKSKYIPGQRIAVKYTDFATPTPDLLDPLANEYQASFPTYNGE
jgi:hypothetical protein